MFCIRGITFLGSGQGGGEKYPIPANRIWSSPIRRKPIERVCKEFDRVAVVINANNVMELGWVDDYDSIQSVILAPGTGTYGMSALGQILDGKVNPSGRNVDTYVYLRASHYGHSAVSQNIGRIQQ